MPRRTRTPGSDESHKENTAVLPEFAVSKSQESTGKGRARHADSESASQSGNDNSGRAQDPASDAEGDEADDQGAGSPKGRKRLRTNTGGDSRPVKDENGKARLHVPILERHTDGYVTGSIVRIQLENFVTYDYVEFCPGPYLNMVLGPNGTGKSSIACGICIGLNFPPSLLGRQDLNSFVKQTRDRGHIEIELKGPPGKPNTIIKRELIQNSKSSTFTINGKQASGREVNSRIAQLNIQVGNLCTFLPQDRVAEFARMSPQQLLKETQRAAGNENLTAWHEALISSGNEFRALEEVIANEREQLKTAEERNAALEKEVKRYEERLELERKLSLLELILPSVEYLEAREEYRRSKGEHRKQFRIVGKLKKKHAPMLDLQKELDQRGTQASNARKDKVQISKDTHKQLKSKNTQYENAVSKQEEAYEALTRLKAEDRDRQKKISEAEKAVNKILQERDNPPEHEDMKVVEGELGSARAKLDKVRQDLSNLQYKQRQNISEEARIRRDVEQHRESLKRLDNVSHRKLENLRRKDQDCADTVVWLRKNQDRFKYPIMEPPCISMNISDQRYVDAIDNMFNHIQMKTFVAQCDQDYKLFMHLVADTDQALGRRGLVTGWYRNRTNVPPPMTEDELKATGFDGYAIDFIECPDELRWFLQGEVRLHRNALALDSHKVDVNRAIDLVGRNGGASFVTGTTMHTVTRSQYGRRLASSMTKDLRRAQWLGQPDVDPSVKANHERLLKEAETLLSAATDSIRALGVDERALLTDEKTMKGRYDAIQARKTEVIEVEKKIATIGHRLTTAEAKVTRLRSAPSAEEEGAARKREIDNLTLTRLKFVKEYEKLVQKWERELEEAVRAGLRVLQVTSDRESLDEACKDKAEEVNNAVLALTEARSRYFAAKQLSKEKLDLSRARIDAVDEDTRMRFQTLENSGKLNGMKPEEVNESIQEVAAELEMNLATNKNVLEQFQKRKAEIEALTATLADREAKRLKIENQIKTARDNWEPALTNLVESIGAKFSAAFDRVGCAGEIRISRADDYNKWAIDILVKFRDTEKLQLLTAQRQSGGERSLTTILYLMSLTEQARSPFSLVDEINQGMDHYAERAVHNQLVDVTCNSDVGQYFLITPKLLPNLEYHERMKVLCVNNGEWLPDDTRLGNMMNMIEGYASHRNS